MMEEGQPVSMHLASQRLDEPYQEIELAYVDWGERSAERVIVCVHGLTRNARDFDALAQALAGQGARVLAIDLVGRGRSSWLADPQDYTAPNYAAHALALLAKLGVGAVDWIGTSLGGIMGMAIAAQEGSPIQRLVLNDIGPFIPKEALQQIQSYVGLDMSFESLEALEAHLRVIHAGFGPLTDAQWRHLAEHSAKQSEAGWQLHYDPDIRVPYAEMAADDVAFWELWDEIACPTFVLRGADSPLLLPQTAQDMQQRGPRAKLATFAGVGHAPALMSQDQISTIAGWLDLDSQAVATVGSAAET